MDKRRIEKVRLILLLILIIFAFNLVITQKCNGQTLSLTYRPRKAGLGVMFKQHNVILYTDLGTYKMTGYSSLYKEELTVWTTGFGISFYEPRIFGKWDDASFDIILCGNIFLKEKDEYYIIPRDNLKSISLELGVHRELGDKITATLHYDIIHREGRIGFGFKFDTKQWKK